MFWLRSSLLALLWCGAALGHAVSISNGELQITGHTAEFELRMPLYEMETVADPAALLDQLRFGTSRRTAARCAPEGDWMVCHATYGFDREVTDSLEVECTLFRATVPNHIHMLYVSRGEMADQRVFDQNTTVREMRLRRATFVETLTGDGASGALRLVRSVSSWLCLLVIALAARSFKEFTWLALVYLGTEWLARPIGPFIPIALSTKFLDAMLAIAVMYLCGEFLFLPSERSKWILIPLTALIQGLSFTSFPALFLAGAQLVQMLALIALSAVVLRLATSARRIATIACLIAAGAWFVWTLV